MADRDGARRWRSLGRRVFLLVLVFAAGVSLLPPEVSAQPDPLTWKQGTSLAWNVTQESLAGTQTQQTVTVTDGLNRQNLSWGNNFVVACSWTAVQPSPIGGNTNLNAWTGCRMLNSQPTFTGPALDSNITPTATEIANGGVVVLIASTRPEGLRFFYAEWVPLVIPAEIVVSRGTSVLALTEGGSAGTYNVKLTVAPAGNVVVRVASGDGGAVSVNKAGGTAAAHQDLTFTTTTWNTDQAITLAAVDDDDADDERVTITHAVRDADSSDEYDNANDVTFTATVADDDIRPVVSPQAVTVAEEGSGESYTVALNGAPTGEVTVTSALVLATNQGGSVTVAAGEVTVTPGALTYDATTWNTAQAVTVSAGHDADGVDETLTVEHTLLEATAAVTVTVEDNDAPPGVTVSATTLRVTEPQTPAAWTAVGTYTVVLDAGIQTTLSASGGSEDVGVRARAGTVGVRLTSARTTTPGNSAELGFFAGTWNTAQTVTVHAQADANGVNEAVTVSHAFYAFAVASGYYPADNVQVPFLCPRLPGSSPTCTTPVVIADVTVNVADNDTPGLVVDTGGAPGAALRVAETEGEPYTVALATEPSAAVEVTVTSGNAAVTVAPATLTFSATNWNTAQTVTARAVADNNQDGETVTVTHTLAGAAEYVPPALAAATVATVTVQVTDDDAPGLALSGAPLTVGENAAESYTVALYVAPTVGALVTVTVGVPAGSPVTVDTDGDPGNGVDANTLTFDTTDWNMAQAVSVRAGDDADGQPDTVVLTHAVTSDDGNYHELESRTPGQVPGVTLTVTDDDTRGVALDTDPVAPGDQTGSLAVTEGHATLGSAAYTVRLATQPVGGVVTVTVAATAGGSATGAVTVRPAPLLFTASDWNTARTVTATAADDGNATGESVTLTHTAVGGDYTATSPAPATLTVAVTDDDVPGLNVSVATLEIAEGAGTPSTGQYTVRLNTDPAGTVTVGITETPAANPDIAASPTALTFDAGTWATAQAVTVTVQADADAADDTTTLRHEVTGSGATAYPTELTAVDVAVTVADAQTARVTLSETTLALEEDHATEGSQTYTVVLDPVPTADVVVTLTTEPTGAVTVVPGALTFSDTSWNTAQTVTATAVADDDGADAWVRVTHDVTGAAEYAAVTVDAVTVQVTDDDTVGLVLTPSSLTGADAVTEGGQGDYTVGLTTEPTGDVAVEVRSATADVALQAAGSGAQGETVWLRFTPGDWQAAQTVTVHALWDADEDPATAQLAHAATGGGYAAVTASLDVAVTDTTPTAPSGGTPAIAPAALSYTFRERRQVRVQLPAATVGDAPLTYTLTPALPAGLAYDATRRIVGAATAVPDPAMGTYTHTVTDADGETATQTVTITIAGNPRPTFTQQPAATYRRGDPYALPAPMGTYAGRLAFALTPALQAGLWYTPPVPTGGAGTYSYADGGTIRGVPEGEVQTTQYTLTVTDADGDTATERFRLAEPPASPPPAPGPTQPGPGPAEPPSPPEPDGGPSCGDAVVPAQVYRAGEAISAVVLPAATGGVGPLRYGVGPEIPAGLTYTAPADPTATGGVLTGVPVSAQAATAYTLTATEADGATTALLTFTIRVAGPGQIRAQAGTRTYALGGRTVTVTQAAGTLAGVELTLPGRLAEDVAITLAPPGAEVPLAGKRYRFGPADAQAAVAVAVTPVPAGGLDVCVPVSAEVRAAARERAVQLVRYVGGKWTRWARIAGAEAEPERVCGAGMTWFGPLAAGYANTVPTFGERTIAAQTGMVAATLAPVALPTAEGGDGPVQYALVPALPTGLSYTLPTESAAGAITGVPTEAQPPTEYTLTATDIDGDAATLAFTLAVEREPVQVSIADATATEGAAVEFPVTLSRAVAKPVTVEWTAGEPGSATPGEDYPAEAAGRLTLAAGTTTGTLLVRTLDDRRVEPTETFTVTVTLPADPLFESADATAEGRIEDDDTEQARKRSVGMVLAGVGRTLATDAVDVIGARFVQQPPTPQATVGGQALNLRRDSDTARWRHAAGVAYGVARALGVEVGSPLEGGAGEFGQVRGAAWSALTRHLRDPHAAAAPLSAWDTPGTFAAPGGLGLDGLSSAAWGTPSRASAAPSFPPAPSTGSGTGWGLAPASDGIRGRGLTGESSAGALPFGRDPFPGLAGYGPGLGRGSFDRAHAATPQALKVGTFRAPVQFRRVSGAEVLSQSAFELPLSRAAANPSAAVRMAKADPTAPMQPGETAPQAAAAAWTLWGRGTASGFDGRPKDDFSMDGNVFTGYLGLDYRLQPNILLGLAVAHSQGDVDYETTDVTKGAVDLTLTSVLPYAHWSPRPGLGVWGLFGAGWGDLKLRDEAGKVKTDLEMLMASVGARQEVLTWRWIDVALKADAFLTELEVDADDRLPKTAGDAQRLRLMVEGRTAWAISEDSHLTPIFEIGGRWDGGKAETGVGAELGGGFEYAHTKLGLGIEARGRYLLAHQKSAFDEWGASLTLKLDPGEAKRGLWLALAPVWGAEASQVEQMWGSADVLQTGAESDTKPGLSPAQVAFDVGYGLVTHEGAGLLTTYGGLSMAGPQSHGYRLGGRIELGEWIDLSVEGERTTQGGAAAHQVALYGHLGW